MGQWRLLWDKNGKKKLGNRKGRTVIKWQRNRNSALLLFRMVNKMSLYEEFNFFQARIYHLRITAELVKEPF